MKKEGNLKPIGMRLPLLFLLGLRAASKAFDSMECGIVCIVKAVRPIDCSAAEENDIVSVKFKIRVLKTIIFSVSIAVIDQIANGLPRDEILGAHQRKEVSRAFVRVVRTGDDRIIYPRYRILFDDEFGQIGGKFHQMRVGEGGVVILGVHLVNEGVSLL